MKKQIKYLLILAGLLFSASAEAQLPNQNMYLLRALNQHPVSQGAAYSALWGYRARRALAGVGLGRGVRRFCRPDMHQTGANRTQRRLPPVGTAPPPRGKKTTHGHAGLGMARGIAAGFKASCKRRPGLFLA